MSGETSQSAADRVITVAELTRRVRRACEQVSTGEWVQGEIGTLTRSTSGHVYFTLKDEAEEALVECVMYKFQATRARRFLEEGQRVLLLGKATVWAPRGRLQFVAERLRPAGRGAMLVALEALKAKLAEQGLFNADRKRKLPEDPKIVGVVTSASGAAFHDIVSVALRRSRVRIVLSAATVQGEGARQSLLRALDRIERYPGLDVLIVGRGGGSSEDLSAFSDEAVIQRLAAIRVPWVSAVGHETDLSLADLVADARAATPSAAAELVIPDDNSRRERLMRCTSLLRRAMLSRLFQERHRLEAKRGRLSDPRFILVERQHEVYTLTRRMGLCVMRELKRRRFLLSALHARSLEHHPRVKVERLKARLFPLRERLNAAGHRVVHKQGQRLGDLGARLEALSPLGVLARGYSLCQGPDQKLVTSVESVRVGQKLRVRLVDGALESEITRITRATRSRGSALPDPEVTTSLAFEERDE